MSYAYEVIRTNRKTIAIEITKAEKVLVRCPLKCGEKTIADFIDKYDSWIVKHMEIIKERNKYALHLTDEQIKLLTDKAKNILPQKVDYYSKLMKLYPTAIKITKAQTRFGSCSGKNSICFSYMLMMYPDKAIDYVVVHELAHIKHKDHSTKFYKLIENYMPKYKQYVALLKQPPQNNID